MEHSRGDALGARDGDDGRSPESVGPQPDSPWMAYAGAGVVLAIGLYAIVASLDLGYWDEGPGPGFFPFWLGVLLAVLAVIWAVQLATGAAGMPVREAGPSGTRDVVLTLLGLGASVLLLEVLGYQLTMFLLVLFQLLVVSHRRWLESLIFAAVAGFGVYTLFAYVLQVYLPTASLPFLAALGL